MDDFKKYCQGRPSEVIERLQALRALVLESVPEAQESISYEMPAFKYLSKPLVYFGAFKNHIGVYATPTTHSQFVDQLAPYKTGKGSVQFKNDQPLPLKLIRSMILIKRKEIAASVRK